MTVIGNDAWIGGTITGSSDPTVVGSGSWWHVTDNGEGANAPADITTFLGIGTAAQTQASAISIPPTGTRSRSTAATSRSATADGQESALGARPRRRAPKAVRPSLRG